MEMHGTFTIHRHNAMARYYGYGHIDMVTLYQCESQIWRCESLKTAYSYALPVVYSHRFCNIFRCVYF